MSVGLQLLAGLIAEGDIILYRKLSLSEKLFYGPETLLFQYVNGHVQKYNVLPKPQTVSDQFQGLPAPLEPITFYADQVEQRYMHKRLNKVLSECNDLMKTQDTFTAQALITEALADLRTVSTRTSMAEFTQQAHDLYMAQYLKEQKGGFELRLGWPTLDKFGGLRGGEVLSIIGRPASGKSQLIVRSAMQAMMHGHRILCISMEMSLTEIMERLVALYTKFPMSHVQNYGFTTKQQSKFPGALLKAKNEKGKLWILDGNFASTPDEVFSLAHQLNPHALLIDAAYLLGNEDIKLDGFRRITTNLERIKRRSSEMDIPVILSYQFNRGAIMVEKKSKGVEKGGLEHIYGSDAVGQISSVVLGMFQPESVETIIQREVHILKGRKGQTGKFKIAWDWVKMNFEEIEDDENKKKGQLQYV